MSWRTEIDELHHFFEAYFLGTEQSLERAEMVLAADFTHVGPDGEERDRSEILAMLRAGHGHTNSLAIGTDGHRLIADDGAHVVAAFVEHHELGTGGNTRRHTVVFRREPTAPNGLTWLRVQETWISEARDPDT